MIQIFNLSSLKDGFYTKTFNLLREFFIENGFELDYLYKPRNLGLIYNSPLIKDKSEAEYYSDNGQNDFYQNLLKFAGSDILIARTGKYPSRLLVNFILDFDSKFDFKTFYEFIRLNQDTSPQFYNILISERRVDIPIEAHCVLDSNKSNIGLLIKDFLSVFNKKMEHTCLDIDDILLISKNKVLSYRHYTLDYDEFEKEITDSMKKKLNITPVVLYFIYHQNSISTNSLFDWIESVNQGQDMIWAPLRNEKNVLAVFGEINNYL